MMKLLAIAGSVSDESRTAAALREALRGAEQLGDVETTLLEFSEHDLVDADGRRLEDYTGDTRRVLDAVVDSDAYLIGTPVYRASYSGVLKNLFDMIPRGRWQADVAPLEASAVGLVATGASPHHYLAIDDALRPVMAFFGAHCVGAGVYLTDEHFRDAELGDDAIRDRLGTLGRATVELSRAIEQHPNLARIGPQV